MIGTLEDFTQQLMWVNGVRINAVTGGSGQPILLLHGWPETWWEWHDVMPLLARHFSVVAIDLRGAGFSDCPLDGYEKAVMARDAHEVMVALGHERYAVCGHDIGGMVALPQAAIYREAVTHLAVLDVPLPGWTGWEATIAKLWHFSFHMNRDLPERLIHGREYDYVSTFMAERFYDHNTFDPADIDIYAKAMALPAARVAGWNGIAPSPPITQLRSSTRSSRSRSRCSLWAGNNVLARTWRPCSKSSPATLLAARSRDAATMWRTNGRMKSRPL